MAIVQSIGTSISGSAILMHANTNLQKQINRTLIIAGIHGDERATVVCANSFITAYGNSFNEETLVCVIPLLNPDGYENKSRYNAHGVDLNRNFPFQWNQKSEEPAGLHALSEPESQALYTVLQRMKPTTVISLHWALSEIDADGEQSFPLAEHLWNSLPESEKRRYRLKHVHKSPEATTEYSGTVGQLCGYGIVYPDGTRPQMVTIELPYTYETLKEYHPLPEDHFETVVKQWEKDQHEYLRHIEPALHSMLYTSCTISGL